MSYTPSMTQRGQEILCEALALSTKERARVAAELIASIDGEPDPDADVAWAEEIERRARRVLTDGAKGDDGEVVLARIERKLRRK